MSQYFSEQERYFWKLSKNAAQCVNCFEIIESKHRHDYVTCTCGGISVDGGLDYIKRSGSFSKIIELSESRKFTDSELKQYIDYYSRQAKENKIYSATYYEKTINAAKYYRDLWYNTQLV